jgi:acetyl esterase/lipase
MTFLHPAAVAVVMLSSLAAQSARFRDAVFAQVQVTNNIAYGAAVNRFTNLNETLRLDLYQPQGDTAPARPAVVIVHGGGFTGGDKATAQMVQQAQNLARRGYVAVSINYRLAPTGTPITRPVITDAAHDGKAAIRWLRAQATSLRIDSTRIASIGSSAGAYTVLEAAYVPGEGSSGNPGWPSHVRAVVDQWGALVDLNELQAGEVPVCIVHGTNDPTVPYVNATRLKARADAVGVPAELHPIQGAGHAPWATYFANYEGQVIAFLWEHLRLSELAGLSARPGYASPGSVTFDTFGIASDVSALCVAAATVSLPVPGWGTLCLHPGTLVLVHVTQLAAAPRLPSATVTLPLPGGLAGASLPWQALHSSTAAPRGLTNCVVTTF